jgi:16S rRNA (guanine966-N2)-methyltransferase
LTSGSRLDRPAAVRVIAGRYGGRRLSAPAGSATRPTSDRVREAVFSMLTALGGLDAARVLDLFGGSGALGIEALSRGAAAVTFVERDDVARAVLRANLAALGLDASVARVRGGEALAVLAAVAGDGERFDLVLVDPPYADAAGLGVTLGAGLDGVLASGALVVCESDRRSPIDLKLPVERERRYGDTLIRIYRQAG